MIRSVGRALLMIRSTTGGRPMTLTIATRWQVTFRVQALARGRVPTAPPASAPQRRDALAIAQAQRLHEELEAQRFAWEKEALFCFRRML
jgi:hypothetical protein